MQGWFQDEGFRGRVRPASRFHQRARCASLVRTARRERARSGRRQVALLQPPRSRAAAWPRGVDTSKRSEVPEPSSRLRIEGDAWIIRGAAGVRGFLAPPADKSLAHRALLLAALADSPSTVRHLSGAEDVERTLEALHQLGVRSEAGPDGLRLRGVGLRGLRAPQAPIDCGNSGTTMRLLCGLLAAQPFASQLFGDASLSRRPMQRLAAPLRAMGARVHCLGEEGRPPLQIEAAPELRGGVHTIAVDSAQVRSALLLAGLYARGPTRLRPAGQARDHLERMLRALGVRLEAEADGLVLEPGGASWSGFVFEVPGDLSAAAFFVAGAMSPRSGELQVEPVGLNPGRQRYLELLQGAGARLETRPGPSRLGEPTGAFKVRGPLRSGMELGGADVVRCIDEIPALVAACAAAGVSATVHDAGELRRKESDRIAGLVQLLRAFGVAAVERPDGFHLEAGARLRPARVSSQNDHRLAMAAAILALSADGESRIDTVDCVRTSYPDFATDFARLADA